MGRGRLEGKRGEDADTPPNRQHNHQQTTALTCPFAMERMVSSLMIVAGCTPRVREFDCTEKKGGGEDRCRSREKEVERESVCVCVFEVVRHTDTHTYTDIHRHRHTHTRAHRPVSRLPAREQWLWPWADP